MNNYYFKFQIGNAGFEKWLKTRGDGKICPLSIYFGNWTASEIDKVIEQKIRGLRQIEIFSKAAGEKDVYFWIFFESKIYCFKKISSKIEDGPGEYIYPVDGDLPKSIMAELVLEYDKIRLPEFFSNINANQKYNRGTIQRLDGSENDLARALVGGEKVVITADNFHKFLSPTEFETLIFLIFSNDKCICSSFRGGTLKDYDLRVKLTEDYFKFPKGMHWIQVKLKENEKLKINGYLISTRPISDFSNNLIGIDWIRERVMNSPNIKKWLKDITFDYNIISIDF